MFVLALECCLVSHVTYSPQLCFFCFCFSRHEIERRMHPRSMKDFKILAAELETWRRQQTAQIKAAGLDKEKEQVWGLTTGTTAH